MSSQLLLFFFSFCILAHNFLTYIRFILAKFRIIFIFDGTNVKNNINQNERKVKFRSRI